LTYTFITINIIFFVTFENVVTNLIVTQKLMTIDE